jgi:hypothetical protein
MSMVILQIYTRKHTHTHTEREREREGEREREKYYSSLKKYIPFVKTWINIEDTMLRRPMKRKQS